MTRHGRRDCAGLTGTAWLAWLEAHDPRGFPWRALGRPLVDLPYAPVSRDVGATALAPLVSAARAWVVPEPWTRPVPAARTLPEGGRPRAAAEAQDV